MPPHHNAWSRRLSQGCLSILVGPVWCLASCIGTGVHAQEPAHEEPYVPHPWIATAPPAFARAIALGQVRIGTDDERLAKARKQALTAFRIHVEYRFRYNLQKKERNPQDRSQMRSQVVAKVMLKELDFEHRIVLRTGFQPQDPWSTPLVRHEFDHVSISTDPRFLALARRILQRPIRCQVAWPIEKELEPKKVDEAVKEVMSAQIMELERIVQANYDRLDRESSDGQVNLSERARFFADLYAMEWLRKCEFQYLDVLQAIEQDSLDKDVEEHYLFLDPP